MLFKVYKIMRFILSDRFVGINRFKSPAQIIFINDCCQKFKKYNFNKLKGSYEIEIELRGIQIKC